MKVLNLRCSLGHGFEGWFGSEEDFLQQLSRNLVSCPLCTSTEIVRMPSAPRLNLSGAKAPTELATETTTPEPGGTTAAPSATPAAELQQLWMQVVRSVLENTEDVGERFPEEVRRMHYGETETKGIRGQATPEQRAELREEGIEVIALPVPAALKGSTH